MSAWLVRQGSIRAWFDIICWVPLGQTPHLEISLSILYLQLTGKSFPSDMSILEKEHTIAQAFVGKAALLVIDDAWEAAHAQSLIRHLDDATASKTVVSSRVHEVSWQGCGSSIGSDLSCVGGGGGGAPCV